MSDRSYAVLTFTSTSCRRRTRATRCTTANVLQTKVYAQYDKRDRTSYLSKVANFNLPYLHLAPPLGVTQFEFCRDLRHQILESLGYRVALFV